MTLVTPAMAQVSNKNNNLSLSIVADKAMNNGTIEIFAGESLAFTVTLQNIGNGNLPNTWLRVNGAAPEEIRFNKEGNLIKRTTKITYDKAGEYTFSASATGGNGSNVSSVSQKVTVIVSAVADNAVTYRNVKGIKRTIDTEDTEANIVRSANEFNYTLKELSLSINGNSAKVQTAIDGMPVKFNLDLYQSQLGFYPENQVFGLTSETSSGFQLTMFTIEKNSDTFNLIEPNFHLAGSMVISLTFYNGDKDMYYYFQFKADGLNFPALAQENRNNDDPMMGLSELANHIGQPLEAVLESFREIEGQEIAFEFEGATAAPIGDGEAESFGSMMAYDAGLFSTEDEGIDFKSPESMKFDRLIEMTRNGPISMNSAGPVALSNLLIDGVPNSVYGKGSGPYGYSSWSNDWSFYRNKYNNPYFWWCDGYSVYHAYQMMTGNVLNYVMRFEHTVQIYGNNQSGYASSTFKITHNTWVLYESRTGRFSFTPLSTSAMLRITPSLKFTTPVNQSGIFTQYKIEVKRATNPAATAVAVLLHFANNRINAINTILTAVIGNNQLNQNHAFSASRGGFGKAAEASYSYIRSPEDNFMLTVQGVDVSWYYWSFNYSASVTITM